MHPVIAIYSTFLQRAYDGLIHDLAIQNLPVVVAIDRGGIVGPDGPTHQGMFDIAFMRCIPNLIIMTPSSLNEQYLLLNTAYKSMKPCVVRYERASLEVEEEKIPLSATVEIGRAKVLRQGKKVALCCFGSIVSKLKDLSDRYDLTLVDMRFVKPLDVELLKELAKTHEAVISIEEGVVQGGIGQEVYFTVKQANEKVRVELLGLKDEFIMEGSRDELLSEQGLDAASVEKLLLDIGI
jgi:1-deoxy-D-xylulose-5-phosphate synthase